MFCRSKVQNFSKAEEFLPSGVIPTAASALLQQNYLKQQQRIVVTIFFSFKGAEMVGQVLFAPSASATPDASMALATRSLGLASAKKAGEASSATRTSTTAQTTGPAKMAPPASTPARAPTPAPAHLGGLAPIVRPESPMSVLTTSVSTEAHVR